MSAPKQEEAKDEERKPPRRAGRRDAPRTDGLWSREDVAAFLDMSADWIYRRTADGTLPHFKLGHIVRYRRSDIEDWVRKEIEKNAPPSQE